MLKTYCFAWLVGLCLLLTIPIAQAQRSGSVSTNGIVGGGIQPPVYMVPEETPWSHLIDSLTSNLNKSRITSGILYDRALPLAGLHYFGLRQADTTSSAHLRQAYLELYMSAYNRQIFPLTPEQFRERANRVVRHDSVPLAVLDYQFHRLDTLALPDGLLQVQQGLLYDVATPSRSPYLLRSLTLAAPLVDTLRQYTATFVLPPALLLTNRSRRVTGGIVDFNDGGPNRSLLPGQALTITYPGNGRKVVWFIVQFNDGTSTQVRSTIYVKAPTTNYRSIPVTLANLGTVEAQIPFQDYNSTTSLYGQGDVLAVLHNPASQAENDNGQPTKLRRPVIIMDGFDPGDKSRIFQNRSLLPEDRSVYNLLREKGILELLDDTHLQRDLVILNFPVGPRHTTTGATTAGDIDGGADYIERNAFVLVELINRLKPMLANDPATGQPYQFTIIGPSMGGLIARYALAYMEKQAAAGAAPPTGQPATYWQHNTATWVSFDAPHQGAVVPMGDQAYLDFFRGSSDGAAEALYTNLYSPAAKQMLVHHVLSIGNVPTGAPGFRDRFMLALHANGEPGSLGYPVHLRRVALANGRLDGQGDPGGTPCGKMFDMEIKFRTGNAVLVAIGSAISQFFTFGSQSAPTRIASCTVRYAPAPGTSCTVFQGLLNYSYYGYTLAPFGGFYNIPRYGRRVVDSGPQGSWDLSPGGSRPTQESLKKQAEAGGRTGAGREQAYKVEVTNMHPNHCFIPTVSALGFQYQSMSSYQNTGSLPNSYTNLLTRGNLVCNNETPFDAFYAPTVANSEHVTVSDDGMKAFLFRELTPQVVTPILAAGPDFVCPNGGTFTYSLVPECAANRSGQQQPGTTYNWTLTAGAAFAGNAQQVINGGTSQAITFAPTARATVVLSVTAVRTGYVASTPLAKYINITGAYASVTAPGEVPKFTTFDAILDQANTTGPYTWTVTPRTKALILNISTANGPSIKVRATNAGVATITATGTDICTGATVIANSTTVTITPGVLRPAPARPAAYPNPADAVLHIEAPEITETPDATVAPRTAVLYNAQGREVRRLPAPQAAQLSTAGLPEGLYYLLLEQNGRVTRHQIRVQH